MPAAQPGQQVLLDKMVYTYACMYMQGEAANEPVHWKQVVGQKGLIVQYVANALKKPLEVVSAKLEDRTVFNGVSLIITENNEPMQVQPPMVHLQIPPAAQPAARQLQLQPQPAPQPYQHAQVHPQQPAQQHMQPPPVQQHVQPAPVQQHAAVPGWPQPQSAPQPQPQYHMAAPQTAPMPAPAAAPAAVMHQAAPMPHPAQAASSSSAFDAGATHPMTLLAEQVADEQRSLPSRSVRSLQFQPAATPPPLQPGEARVAGLTLHPTLVGWYKAREREWEKMAQNVGILEDALGSAQMMHTQVSKRTLAASNASRHMPKLQRQLRIPHTYLTHVSAQVPLFVGWGFVRRCL